MYAALTRNEEYDFWQVNFVRDTEPEAIEEFKRLRSKGCEMRLFRLEEVLVGRL